jgi:hypothetical protein
MGLFINVENLVQNASCSELAVMSGLLEPIVFGKFVTFFILYIISWSCNTVSDGVMTVQLTLESGSTATVG